MKREKLIEARAKKHWTLKQAAEQINCDWNTLNRWELGKEAPRAYNAQRLCEVYSMTPEELGLGADQINDSEIPEPENEEKDLIGNNLTTRLMALGFCNRCNVQQIHDDLIRIIEEYDKEHPMDIDPFARIKRREALASLVALPALVARLGSSRPVLIRPVDDILTQCAAALAACWELSKGDDEQDLLLAFKGASVYVPTLKAIVKDNAQHRRTAASLVGQCELLKTMLGWHIQGLKKAAGYAEEAIRYAQEAADTPLLLATLDYQAWLYYYDRQSKQALATIEQALPYLALNDKRKVAPLPPRLLGGIYSTLALMSAKNNKSGTQYLDKASAAFFSPDIEEHRFVYMDYTEGDLILNNGMVHYQQDEAEESIEMLSLLIDPESLKAKIALPERSRIEGLNYMSMASLKLQDPDMGQTVRYWQEARDGAFHLGSEQRINEVENIYDNMTTRWCRERRIAELRSTILR